MQLPIIMARTSRKKNVVDLEKKAERIILAVADFDAKSDIAHCLVERGYEVTAVSTAENALQHLQKVGAELAVVDIDLRDKPGVELVAESLEIDPDLAIVVLSDIDEVTSAAICIQQGAYDYLTRPIELAKLRIAVDRAASRRGTLLQSQEISGWLKKELVERTQELERQRQKLEQVNVATLEALINALEAKDPYSSGHSVRVAELSATVADEMGLSDDDIDDIRLAGRLHDIGRIGVRDAVRNKVGPLTAAEVKHLHAQALIGFQIIWPLEHLGVVRDYVKNHKERWDGGGYPDGLKGEDIPIGARIINAAEVYDAFTNPRRDQEKLGRDKAIELLRRLAGEELDPTVVEALANAVKRRRTLVFVKSDLPI